MSDTQTLAVLLEERLITLTRVLGLLRRRNFSVGHIAVEPAEAPGLSKLTVMMRADAATANRAVLYLQKVIGVREVAAFPGSKESQENSR